MIVENISVGRLDHLGVISGIMKELGISRLIDSRILPDDQEEITTGEAIEGMILNGLGFSDRPISLTPQFFENKPLDTLFREGVRPEYFNRFKLGRSLDKVCAYGCDLLFSELALCVCHQEGVDQQFNSLDTTTFSVSGEYIPDTDEQAILITHGYSKDHRPDLKQAVLEIMVSQDGGVPLACKSFDGNRSDNEVFKARTKALIEQFKTSESPRYLIADSKLYTQENASNLACLPFVTRIPETLKVVGQVIDQAWDLDGWQMLDEANEYQRLDLGHYGIDQRWLVVYSKAKEQRAQKTITKATDKEYEKVKKQLFHLQAQRFESEQAAQKALHNIVKKLTYHQVNRSKLTQYVQYAKKGRPTKDTPIKAIRRQIQTSVVPDPDKIKVRQQRKACFVIGTSIPDKELTDKEVFAGYKGQSAVERGFRFLKEPVFFVSSLFVKKPSRIQGLLMVMTLALLVYSVAQRRMRNRLETQGETLPNQIGQPTATSTLRWVFQLLDGIHRVTVYAHGQIKTFIDSLTDLRKKILQLFGQTVCQIYQISSA